MDPPGEENYNFDRERDEHHIFDRGRNHDRHDWFKPNEYLRRILIASLDPSSKESLDTQSTTELDSHANMVVMGKYCEILEDTGKVIDVTPFTPDYEPKTTKIVDAAIKYVSEYNGKEYVLVFRNSLYFPSMNHNLVPPFIMREKGIEVNDVPKIHLDDPSENDHSIYLRKYDVRIPLKIRGTFSYFNSYKPSDELLSDTEEIYDMTPIHWNPYDTAFAQNEASMLDWEGNIKEPRDRKKILLSEVEPDLEMESDLSVSAVENKYIDSLSHADTDGWCPETYVPVEADEVKRHLSDVSPVLDAEVMSLLVQDKARVGKN